MFFLSPYLFHKMHVFLLCFPEFTALPIELYRRPPIELYRRPPIELYRRHLCSSRLLCVLLNPVVLPFYCTDGIQDSFTALFLSLCSSRQEHEAASGRCHVSSQPTEYSSIYRYNSLKWFPLIFSLH